MITNILNFKIFESGLNNVKIYNSDEFYEYISTNGPQKTFDPRFLRKNDGGKKAFKYYEYQDYSSMYVNVDNTIFFGIFENDIMVGLSRIYLNDINKSKNIWWLTYLCIDPIYEGKGYATQLADYIFKYFKQNNYTFETSSYTEQGFIKLKPLFNRLALKYNVTFIDKEKF
jgi:GNAT superfamily N-acetyltransferase